MTLLIIAYFGGILTILSPCILPVLPFVFARAQLPFARSGLPMLLGMALTFGLVASIAAVGGGWAVQANQYGRVAALVLLAFFGATLLSTTLADRITRPFVALGSRLSSASTGADGQTSGWWSSFALGIATGLLWAPCAGPILGLVLTGAALNGASVHTSLLLLAYAAGAATSLALALLAGKRVFATLKRSLGIEEWIRRGLGVAVLLGVAAIALGLDTGLLTRLSSVGTNTLEQRLIDRIRPADDGAMMMAATSAHGSLPVEGNLPELSGAVSWLNSPPLTTASLRGKVVLVDFWTYSCINCLRTLPYVKAWAEKYKPYGLVVIGVHAPEFAFEKDLGNVRHAVSDLGLNYPIAIDNDYTIWRAFNNEYWPAHYFADAQGKLRHHHFGEGSYDESERVIQNLLREAGHSDVPTDLVSVKGNGIQADFDTNDLQSGETYIGYERASGFVSVTGKRHDAPFTYHVPAKLKLNEWALGGVWTVHDENAALQDAGGRISFRFHARDLHLVLGPDSQGKPVRFRILIDNKMPGNDHGTDINADGEGTVTDHRLYQLVRQHGDIADHTFSIEFLDPGVQAYSFTFG